MMDLPLLMQEGKCYLCERRIDRDYKSGYELLCAGMVRRVCEECYKKAKIESEKKRLLLKNGFQR